MTKRNINKTFIILAILIGSGLVFKHYSNAETASEVSQKIDDSAAQIRALEQEIATYQNQLNDLANQSNTLANALKELDISKKKLETSIKITQSKINSANLIIKNLSGQIGNKNQSIENNLLVLSKNIESINNTDQNSFVGYLLSTEDLSGVWKEIDNLNSLNSNIKSYTKDLRDTKKELEDTKLQKEKVKNDLMVLSKQLNDQKKIVDQNTKEKNKLLLDTKNNEKLYQKNLAEKMAQKNSLESQIRDLESQLKFILDPSTLPNGRVLSWPLAKITITQRFGKTVDSARLYVSGSHSGVDFGTPVGTPVFAMASGTVAGTGDTDVSCPRISFGKWVFIKYDDGLSSTYGHLSLINAYAGQRVHAGDLVAYSGNTGYSTGPHLHVSLYASGSVSINQKTGVNVCVGKTVAMPIAAINGYLDPLQYLPATTSSMFKPGV